ncbi:nitrate- and nitrite sensing domain-containing protein [Prauserella rugosa]|uniref:histidine kinase n=1 Tax=Prauserella rugosa TaxID=43354 RepID=A0A660C5Y5_9PSEU|nr:nitrate- and nitrite sensing domain-containing protein [Prauserella rugosa]KMS88773.1 hypothetical protein ACZ91_23985 [Streptomyces regensis]TWH19010.1 signal transduction histidine kinase [Prauserella rugosa]
MPVGQLLGEDAPKPSPWKALARWRDWKLPAKLGAVTLIPIVIALVLGGLTLGTQLDRADRYDQVAELAQLNAASRTLLDALQRERTETAAALTTGAGTDTARLDQVRADVDEAVGPVRSALNTTSADLDALAEPREQLNEQLDRLSSLRERVRTGQLGAIQATSSYSVITSSLLTVDVAAVSGMGDDAIGGTPTALHDVMVASEEVSIQQALVTYGIDRGGLAPSEFDQLRTSSVRLEDRLAEFSSAATVTQRAAFNETVRGDAFDTRESIMRGLLAGQDANAAFGDVSAQEWQQASNEVFGAMGEYGGQLGGEVTATADERASGAHAGVVWLAVLFVLALALAAVVVFVITRHLLRSLNVLRTSALDVADRALPEAVQSIQDGQEHNPVVRPVPVSTDDEIGQVARAFDAVHSQALRLAVEQAGMRAGYAGVFVNLSRRSQSLVQRQLQLIERLERDEEDADQLATLFQLDHLATRMRRNNENLMVLSGDEPGRRSGRPVSVTDVLRAAVSEIEQYQRVAVNAPPQARIVGYAAGDLVRLVAELLDNATAFSAPETRVTVSSTLDDGVLQVEIVDRGIGMNEAELEEANGRLTDAGPVDIATSRRMGLFVVGRLAGRHGFEVQLRGGKDVTGVTAVVRVPKDVVIVDHSAPTELVPAQAPSPASGSAGGPTGSTPVGTTRSGLPQRGSHHGASVPTAFAPLTQGGDAPSENEVSGTALFSPITDDRSAGTDGSGSDGSSRNGTGQNGTGQNGTGQIGTGRNGTRPGAPTTGSAEGNGTTASSPSSPSSSNSSGTSSAVPGGGPSIPQQGGPADEGTDEGADGAAGGTTSGLPRRRPGASRKPRPGTSAPAAEGADGTGASNAAAGDTPGDTQPETGEDLSGTALFAPKNTEVTDWWNAKTAGTANSSTEDAGGAATAGSSGPASSASAASPATSGQRKKDGSETTPIFNDTLSAWFRSESDPASDPGWGAADPGRKNAEEAAKAEPEDYTSAGLPRRQRGQKLMPGSATDAGRAGGTAVNGVNGVAHPQPAPPRRDASDVRSRLSSFQQGVSRGRRRKPEPDTAPDAGGEAGSTGAVNGHASAAPATSGTAPQASGTTETGSTDSGTADTGTAHSGTAETGSTVSAQQDTPTTAAGLPQRRRKPKAAQPEATQPKSTQPEATRSKAAQAEESQGGTSAESAGAVSASTETAESTATVDDTATTTTADSTTTDSSAVDSTAVDSTNADTAADADTAAATGSDTVAGSDTAAGKDTAADWTFAADERWRTVQAASDATPSGYTPAGLPRRQRGQQLMPGSATSTGPAGSRPRRERDPADVQGRLSSFQQGIRRGRHRTAQASDSSEQKVEGE